jgi:hypothetical protein
MSSPLTQQRLLMENRCFLGTGGVSLNNAGVGFAPAFCDIETGRTELPRLPGGLPAPMHLLWGLPEEWVASRDPKGGVLALKSSIVAGFLREGRFYSREEAALACAF